MSKKQKQNLAIRDAHITIAKMEIDKALDLLQQNVDEENKPKFMSTQKSLETHASGIDRLSNEILSSLSPEEPEHYVTEMEKNSTIQGSISETIFKLVLSIEKYDKSEQTETRSNHSTPSTNGKSSMKIPKITIKPFSGDKLSYQLFKESFEAGVESKEEMSKIEKFVYLRSLLQGKAEQLVNGLSLTGENYETALKLLDERYGDKQGLINEHTSKLIKLSKVKDVSDTVALRELYDNIECHVRNLDVLKPDCLSTLGTMLITVIVEKIPEELRLLITRKFSNAEWDVRELLDEFKNELSVREKCDIKPQQNLTEKSKSHSQPSAMGLHSGFSKISCAFCKGNHYSDKCETITDICSRKESLRRSGKCFVCLKTGHMSRHCSMIKTCFHCKEKGHNSALCEKKSSFITGDSSSVPQSTQNYATVRNNKLLLKTAEARVYNDSLNDYTTARVLFDEGSQRSYVSDRLCNLLKLKTIDTETLSLGIFGSTLTKPRTMQEVILHLADKNSNKSIQIDALSVPYICPPITEQPIEIAKSKFSHLQDLNLADSNTNNSNLEIDILIGVDHFWEFFTGEIKKGPPYTPTAMKSLLGWVLSGPVLDESTTNFSHNCVTTSHAMRVETSTPKQLQKIENQLSKFWDLESLGIDPNESTTIEKLIDKLELNEENHYEVTLPFKEEHPTIHDNYELCRNRLSKLHQKLSKDPELFERYDNTFREQLEKGIIERADEPSEIGATHYIPHHPVVREDRQTTKLRVVFDASAKSQGPSLNECLYKGPQLTPLLYDILLRFRSYPIALTADIEKAFFQISIARQDRDYLRFLWFNDITSKTPSIVKYRFTRVPFGLNSSPFVLNGTLKKHTEKFANDIDFVTKTRDSLYVDDFTGGDDNIVAATKLHSKLNNRFQSANFNFRKWRTNDPMLRSLIADEDLNCESQKILGVKWDDREDTLIFDLNEIAATTDTQQALTKRIMLRTLSSFFDPLGMLQPIIVGLKIMFQEACKFTKDWDQTLPNDIQQKWFKRINEIHELKSIKVNRTYAKIDPLDPVSSHEIHGFSDASNDAYGASVYLKSIHESGNTQISLVSSKSKVAPIKMQTNPDPETTPRLELLGNLLLARLTNTVVDALKHRYKAERVLYWTDSTASLSWIKTNLEAKAFVENRIKEIRKRTDKNNWFHVKGENNPADIITRNISVKDLTNNTLWWNGPAELRLSTDEQMTLNINNTNLPPPQEIKKQTSTNIAVDSSTSPIKIERFNRLNKLYRVTAYVMRFVNNFVAKFKLNIKYKQGVFTTNELNHAEHYWLKTAQKNLQLPKQVDSFNDNEGIQRYNGRLQNAPIPLAARHPILLPSRHHLTELIVLDTHRLVKHAWVKDTLTEVRQRYWIPKGRNFVRKLLFKCRTCRKHQTTHYSYPRSPPLSSLRTQDSRSFAVTGIDNFGPVNVKDIFSTKSRTHKTWATLYTCASSRAIVLDLVGHPSALDFKASLTRFISRRGCPDHIITDNGSNFTADETKLFATERNIIWHLNVPLAPWYGGFFERLIKIVKTLLKKLLGTATYRFDEIQTFLLEIEHIVNNRPITYMYGDEVEPCLTPNHLVFGRRLNLKSAFTNEQLPTNEPPSYSKLETTLNDFWKRWRNEYLTELREHQRRTSTKKTMNSPPNVGDIVIIEEEYTPRSFWRVAKITELHPGTDGQCRSATVKLAKTGNVIKRTVNKLYPIERYEKNDTNDIAVNNTNDIVVNDKNDSSETDQTRNRRNAAIIADLRMINLK